jgi:hypothetical protein
MLNKQPNGIAKQTTTHFKSEWYQKSESLSLGSLSDSRMFLSPNHCFHIENRLLCSCSGDSVAPISLVKIYSMSLPFFLNSRADFDISNTGQRIEVKWTADRSQPKGPRKQSWVHWVAWKSPGNMPRTGNSERRNERDMGNYTDSNFTKFPFENWRAGEKFRDHHHL